MVKRFLIVMALLVLCIFAAACTTQQAPPATPAATTVPVPETPAPPAFPQELSGSWVLTTMGVQGGNAVMYPLTEMTLTISEDGSMSGYNGCNNYYAKYTVTSAETPKGQGIIISDLSNSTKYCETLEDQDQIYLNILAKTAAFSGESTHLSFTSSEGDTLAFQRQAAAAAPTWDRGY